MEIMYIALALGIAALFALKYLLPLLARQRAGDLPYEARGELFTAAERSFLAVLDEAVGDRYRIMGQVRLADVIKVKGGLDRSSRGSAFAKIRAKHLDFVACDPSNMNVVFAVELDDSSHQRESRRRRDEFLEQAMATAGVQLFRFPVRRSYDVEEVRQVIFAGSQ